jgi:hypothetical protein
MHGPLVVCVPPAGELGFQIALREARALAMALEERAESILH